MRHLEFLEQLDRVNRVIQASVDLDSMMSDVLDLLLDVFSCDRAWLVFPCDPQTALWRVPMERTRPAYPGGLAIGVDMPLDPMGAHVFSILLAASGPVVFGPDGEHAVPEPMARFFSVRSFIAVAIFPKVGQPWSFGLHQCTHERIWTADDRDLLQEIGRRIADGLTSLLVYRDLQLSSERFRTFIDHATDAYYLHDPDGIILDVNRQACEMLGYERDELVGQHWRFIDCALDPSMIGHVRDQVNACGVVSFDTRHRRKDGSSFPAEVRIRGYREGASVYGISLVRDMTERSQLEAQFRQAQKMEAIGRLAGGVAHDFNNLLMVINGNSQLLIDTLTAADPARDLVREIHQCGLRAAALTRQLLAFSRKQVLQPTAVHLNAVLPELCRLLQRLIGMNVELVTDLRADPDMVQLDRLQFEQAIVNLAVNARDAMPHGGQLLIETRTVVVASSHRGGLPELQQDSYVVVSVSDTGFGMDEATRAQIFEPFFTTKEPGHGTGLGLAMVYGFVQQTGGHIEVSSQPNQGATFRLFFPSGAARAPGGPRYGGSR